MTVTVEISRYSDNCIGIRMIHCDEAVGLSLYGQAVGISEEEAHRLNKIYRAALLAIPEVDGIEHGPVSTLLICLRPQNELKSIIYSQNVGKKIWTVMQQTLPGIELGQKYW